MASLSLKNVNKIYDNNVQAVFDFNIDVADGEFIVLVGPSGCGKSTTLRMIAGLEDISSGTLIIDGEDVTLDVLEHPGYTFLLVARNLKRTNEGMLDIINDLHDYARVGGHPFYMVTSSSAEAIDRWNERTGAAYPYLNADETMLKTMVRTNLGLIVLKDATVIGKWSGIDLPRDEQLAIAMERNGALMITPREVQQRHIAVLLWMFLPLLLLCCVDALRKR